MLTLLMTMMMTHMQVLLLRDNADGCDEHHLFTTSSHTNHHCSTHTHVDKCYDTTPPMAHT